MVNKLNYHLSLYKKFGARALLFLLQSKFLKNKLVNRSIKDIRYPLQLSNFNADVTTLFQIFYAREYAVRGKIEPRYIVDCGANVGFSAVWFANAYPGATIIAIEPDERNFEFLKRNTERYPNIICINKAVWPHQTTVSVHDVGTGNWSLRTIESKTSAPNTVATISIPNLLDQFEMESIDILKIDIEGAEKELFSSNFQSWLPKTGLIAIELHDNIDERISEIFYKAIEGRSYKKYFNGENLICDFRNPGSRK